VGLAEQPARIIKQSATKDVFRNISFLLKKVLVNDDSKRFKVPFEGLIKSANRAVGRLFAEVLSLIEGQRFDQFRRSL